MRLFYLVKMSQRENPAAITAGQKLFSQEAIGQEKPSGDET